MTKRTGGRPETAEHDEQGCIERAKEGDKGAFRELVERHQGYAFALALRLLGDETEAEDIVQETFIRIWKNMHKFDVERKFTTWMYTIATNLARDRLRSRKRSRERFAGTYDDTLAAIAGGSNPEIRFSNRELAEIITELTAELSPTQRIVFTLRDLQDLSVSEVCAITDLSAASVKTNLHFARKAIRDKLERRYQIVDARP